MSDFRDETIVGNDSQGTENLDVNQNSGEGQMQVNPGAIRKSQTQGILNALSAASGQQFESVEAAASWAARVSAMASQSGGSAQPKVDSQPRQGRKNSDSDLQEQFQALQNKLATQEHQLREKELDGDIRSAMGEKFDSDLLDYALTKVKSNIQWNDDGTYAIINTKGQQRYSQDGTPLSIRGLVEEVARSNPKLLKQNTSNSGSGLRPGQGQFAGAPDDAIPDYTRDPAAFNAWAQRNGLGKNVGLKGVGVQVSNSMAQKKVF
ncbi:hypothetical protein UFOVP623_14 [uncultured Caudovirales phage]|uniref:Uncharacterized protein n=1 Tax=uncultured Caudovirales phage TaxID=2100421 RepID=A0A6J5N1A6_9CAUD|nr:hypothetical protein UFOVP623_14 [uncultured Caudovirales phage]